MQLHLVRLLLMVTRLVPLLRRSLLAPMVTLTSELFSTFSSATSPPPPLWELLLLFPHLRIPLDS